MKTLERNRAIELRKQGRSYTEIQKIIPTSKGSLSYWLRDIKLNRQQLKHIHQKNFKIRRKFIEYNQLKRRQAVEKRNYVCQLTHREIKKISRRELKLIGAVLYWAEGYNKNSGWGTATFANSDPKMIALMMKWFRLVCRVPENKFRIRIQCYGAENTSRSEKFWSGVTNVSLLQFTEPYIRISPTSLQKTGNLTPYGVCSIRISDVALLTKIKGWIKGIHGAIV